MSQPVFLVISKNFNCNFNIILVLLMGQVLKIRHCVLKIKVNTNLIVRTGPNKAYSILQLKFYHHSGSSNSESQFQVLTLQVQVQSKSSRNRTRVRLESKSRTRVLQLCRIVNGQSDSTDSGLVYNSVTHWTVKTYIERGWLTYWVNLLFCHLSDWSCCELRYHLALMIKYLMIRNLSDNSNPLLRISIK